MFERKPIFTSQDHARLGRLVSNPAIEYGWPTFVEDLRRKLERGRTVEASEVSRDVATMYSLVRLRDLNYGASRFFVLVYPDEADLRFGRLSVLSQVGTAILGSRAGARLRMSCKRARTRLRLARVVSQPEANANAGLARSDADAPSSRLTKCLGRAGFLGGSRCGAPRSATRRAARASRQEVRSTGWHATWGRAGVSRPSGEAAGQLRSLPRSRRKQALVGGFR